MGCTLLALDRDQLWAFESMEINLRVLQKNGEFLDQMDHAPTMLIILTVSVSVHCL